MFFSIFIDRQCAPSCMLEKQVRAVFFFSLLCDCVERDICHHCRLLPWGLGVGVNLRWVDYIGRA